MVSEEQFYDDLTLNLRKVLGLISGVENVKMNKRLPCEKATIAAWEQRHSCLLPQDLKNFYLSTDGFEMTWDYKYAGELLTIGKLAINVFNDLRRVCCPSIENVNESIPSIRDLNIVKASEDLPSFWPSCKIFELESSEYCSMVCLVYNDTSCNPKIWFLGRSLEWTFLADSFTQYFRMMLFHHGLPEWQCLFSKMKLTPWAQQIMTAIAPHLLSPEPIKKPVHKTGDAQIDASLFKTKLRQSKKNKERRKTK